MNTVVWERLVSTVHPALEDNSIDGDKVGALCPLSGHFRYPHPTWASGKEAGQGPVRFLNHGLVMWKTGENKDGSRKGWRPELSGDRRAGKHVSS